MSLNTENQSRDYVFGRLLAIAEHIERMSLSMAGETRATNAERYMPRFVTNPFKTWLQLQEKLSPYKERLRRDYPVRISEKFVLENPLAFLSKHENEITQLSCVLDELKKSGCDLDKALEPEFLLGYHSQKMSYRNQSNKDAQQNEQVISELN